MSRWLIPNPSSLANHAHHIDEEPIADGHRLKNHLEAIRVSVKS